MEPVGKLAHLQAIFRLYRNPWPRLLSRIGWARGGQERLVSLSNGLCFKVRGGTDFSVLDEVFIHRVYDQVLATIKPDNMVLDIGAHMGVFTVAAGVRGARVHSFEPLSENLQQLRENIRLNSLDRRVRVHCEAVSRRSGSLTLKVVSGDSGGSTSYPGIHPLWMKGNECQSWVRERTVPCLALNDVFEQTGIMQWDAIKMDCEGAEYDILAGATPSDLRKSDKWIMECHPNGDPDRLRARFESADFHVCFSQALGVLFAERK